MAWLVAGCALLGMLAGSFFNVVVHRLPRMLAAAGKMTGLHGRGSRNRQDRPTT